MSSKTPGGELDDRWSLDLVPDVQSWWKFHWSFQRMPLPIWHHLQVNQEPPCPPRLQEETKSRWSIDCCSSCSILMKLLQKLPKDASFYLTPSPCSSGTSMSFKTPWRDLYDRWSLYSAPDVQSWWKFHWSFHRMPPSIWHHLQVYQEPPCPPRL